jgi:tRNA G18 (ribose-2'-O)-methylase SpoU
MNGKDVLPIEQQRAMRETDYFDPRNIADEFKGMDTETIKAILKLRSSRLVVMCSNEIKDFNWGSVVRSANSFGAHEIMFTGRKSYNRRGAVGANNYSDIHYMSSTTEAIAYYRAKDYRIVAIEYDEAYPMQNLQTYDWSESSVILFGEEGRSLPAEILDLCDDVVYVPMYGSVRSLNLASCATVVMYDYDTKIRQTPTY